MLYLMQEGHPTTLSNATGPNVTVNTILVFPFIQHTKMIINTSNQVADLRALNNPPFDIDYHHAICTVPAIEGGTNISDSLAHYDDIVREADRIVAHYTTKSQAAAILLPAKKTRCINFNDSALAPAISDVFMWPCSHASQQCFINLAGTPHEDILFGFVAVPHNDINFFFASQQ
jgi:hypothetical protein